MAKSSTFSIDPRDLAKVATLEDLLRFLRDQLDWPYDATLDDVTFDETPESLGLDAQTPLPQSIRRLRLPANTQCPWGIFLFEFDRIAVPRSTIRRTLRALLQKKRASANTADRARWQREDLLLICSHGEEKNASLTFLQTRKRNERGGIPLASFSWIKGRPQRTVAEFNLPPLRWLSDTATPSEWRASLREAFDKDALTKQFFLTFAGDSNRGVPGIYHQLRDDLLKRNKITPEAAGEKALLILNRLLFLYFIQKKGWLAQDQNFLRNGFRPFENKPESTDFFSEDSRALPETTGFLSALFARLSIEDCPDHRFEAVPFLNGGLFEPDAVDADLKISNGVFSIIFEQLLERYNFTVTEDTPLDVDVAIDPEMLGKIFECLVLQSEQEEGILSHEGKSTKDKRKTTGSYYTPRTIVHFMCQEALKQHLCSATKQDESVAEALSYLMAAPQADQMNEATLKEFREVVSAKEIRSWKDRLAHVRIVDPAVGSGAFIVGMLHEVVRLRSLFELHQNGFTEVLAPNYLHELKKETIEQSLFGVDLQEQAVQLCELRLWLSLVVDYQLPLQQGKTFTQIIRKIPTLPNLGYRIVRGDSLLERLFGEVIQLDVLARDPRSREIIRELKKEKETFFTLRNSQEKRRRELVILEKQVRLAEILIEMKTQHMFGYISESQDLFNVEKTGKERKEEEKQRALLQHWDTLKAKVHAAGEEVRYRLQEPLLISQGNLSQLRQHYFDTKEHPTFFWQVDFAEVFDEKGGFDIVLANPPYIRQEFLKKLTPLLKPLFPQVAEKSVDAYIYFIEQGRRILRDGGTLAYITSSTWTKTAQGMALRMHLQKQVTVQRYVDFGDLQVFEGVTTYPAILLLQKQLPTEHTAIRANVIESLEPQELERELHAPGIIVRQRDLESDGWRFEDRRLARLRQKIKDAGVPLKEYCGSPLYGIKTGLNEAFVIDHTTRDALVAQDPRSVEILKPFLEGKDLKPWHAEWRGLWLVCIPSGWTNNSAQKKFSSEKEAFSYFRKEYPAVANYLATYATRARARSDQGDWYWELRACAYYSEFEKSKIMYPHFSNKPTFLFDTRGFYVINKGYLIPTDDMSTASILASQVSWFFLAGLMTPKRGGFFEYCTQFVETLPIAQPTPTDRKKLAELAEQLGATLGSPPSAVAHAIPQLTPTTTPTPPRRVAIPVAELEAELNDRVAHLYGLTAEEKKIVAGIMPAKSETIEEVEEDE
jgi:adenine-specific DNA-methyltransferase